MMIGLQMPDLQLAFRCLMPSQTDQVRVRAFVSQPCSHLFFD